MNINGKLKLLEEKMARLEKLQWELIDNQKKIQSVLGNIGKPKPILKFFRRKL